jgi:signal transduction histidine kinase
MYARELVPGALFSPEAARLLIAARELSGARELSVVTQSVRRAARDLTGADGATFVLREGDLVHYADEDAIAPLWKGCRFDANACISGWAMIHRTTVVIPDISTDPRIPLALYAPTFVKSLAMVPVNTTEPVAAIGVYWASPHAASAEEVTMLEALAGFAALALENEALLRELRLAVAARDEFLSIASHELRTPIAALRLTLGSGARAPDGPGRAERQAKALARADALVTRLATLVSRLLDVSHVARGGVSLARADVDLSAVVSRVVRSLDEDARADVTERCEPGVVGRWDPARLEQVVDNLLRNALKFGRGSPVEVDVRRADGAAVLTVRDHGIGISPEDRARIFERFERAVSSRHFAGFGIGLWLVRQLVDAHGGTIEVQSRPDEGSTFIVTLPLHEPVA